MSQAVANRLDEASNLTEPQRDRLNDIVWIVNYPATACPTINGEASDTEGIRVLSRSALAKSFRFKERENSDDLNGALADLGRLRMTSPPIEQESTGGRKKHLIYLFESWSPGRFDTASIEAALVARFLADKCDAKGSDEPGSVSIGCHCGLLDPELELEPEPDETQSAIAALIEAGGADIVNPMPLPTQPHATAPGAMRVRHGEELRVLHNFVASFGGNQVISFTKDQIITDKLVCRKLVAQGMPVVSIDDQAREDFCPRCHTPYRRDPSKAAGSAGVCLRPKKNFNVMFAGHLLQCSIDKVISDQIVIAWMLTQPESCPVVAVIEGIDYAECTCKQTFFLSKPPLS